MFFLNERNNEIINSDYVERFRIVEKPDAILLIATYGEDRQAVTLAKYKDLQEAQDALFDLCRFIENGDQPYMMQRSTLYECEIKRNYHGKKQKNHGRT